MAGEAAGPREGPIAYRALASFTAAALWLACTIPLCAQDQDSADSRFLRGLRERQLYQLAETYCLERLDDAQLPLQQRLRDVIGWQIGDGAEEVMKLLIVRELASGAATS